MIVHLIDGTHELFRHFYGIRRFKKTDPPFGAVSGVLHMVAKMIEDGATHIGVATGLGVPPDFTAAPPGLVGAPAVAYPGIRARGEKPAATLINRHGHIEYFPAGVLKKENVAPALLFKQLATLRIDAPLFKNVD